MYFHRYHRTYVIGPTVSVGVSAEAGPSAIPVAALQGMPYFHISQWYIRMLCYRRGGPIDGQVQRRPPDFGGRFDGGRHAGRGH